jgi:DNA-binding response OmpR family regulator
MRLGKCESREVGFSPSHSNVPNLRARGLEECPVPLLTKPFTLDQLLAAVNRLLGVASGSQVG